MGISVTDDLDSLSSMELPPDTLGVVVAYGRIIPAHLLSRVPMVNVHFSLLPRWRGAAPVERAIMAGDAVTGVCIMEMEAGLDTGGVYARAETLIAPDDTTDVLTNRLAHMGAELLCKVLSSELGTPEAQEGESTYAKKISPQDLVIDWTNDADTIERHVRALSPHTFLNGKRVRIVSVTAADGSMTPGELSADALVGTGSRCVRLQIVQPEGKSRMNARDWLRGMQDSFPKSFTPVP